jgi:hypothetical protein
VIITEQGQLVDLAKPGRVSGQASHLVSADNGKHGLRRQHGHRSDWELIAGRSIEVAIDLLDSTIMEERNEPGQSLVVEISRIPGKEPAIRQLPSRPVASPAGTNTERKKIRGMVGEMVAGTAGNVLVSAQDLVEEEQPAELDERG